MAWNFLKKKRKLSFKDYLKEKKQKPQVLVPRETELSEENKAADDKPNKRLTLKQKKLLKIIGVVALIILFVAGAVGMMVYGVYRKAKVAQAAGMGLADALKAQDLVRIREESAKTKTALSDLQKSYQTVVWLKYVPFAGGYVKDGEHAIKAGLSALDTSDLVVDIIEPYADIIGFTNGEVKVGEQETAKDRLDFIVRTIPDVIPQADILIDNVNKIRSEVDQIDPERYPEKLNGREIRSKIKAGIDAVDLTADMIEKGKPLLVSSPYLLGVDKERNYMILFQNDKELRPTGGFLTAYSLAKVEKGKFDPVSSNDIYNLDSNYRPAVEAPEPLIKYLKGPYVLSRKYRLRDLNWSPDFAESMKLFAQEAQKVGIKNIDGIIAVDTQLLVNLLNVLGPIDVPGYGKYSNDIIAECNCPQVIYELESFADIEGPVVWSENTGEIVFAPPNMDNRKKIIGPLMNAVLSNTLSQPKEKMPALFEAAFKSLNEKHVVFYIFDEKHQKAVEEFGIAGRILPFEGDYLHINDSNLGGRKSNLYVTQEVRQDIKIKDGFIEKTLTVTYKNPEKHDGWLNSVLPNWVRIYVPKGSDLISMEGFEEKASPYEEFGKTVFAGYFQLRPQGVARIVVAYKVPVDTKDGYRLLIQKQAGTDAPLYSVSVGKFEDEFRLITDKELFLGSTQIKTK